MYGMSAYEYQDCKAECMSNSSITSEGLKRRRDSLDEDNESVKTSKSSDWSKKQNHSEIEKRRRDKMNTYIMELSSLIPMGTSKKLDKLTVLRMAVQHMKMLRGSLHSYTEGHYKPSFLSDDELKKLILQAADGFLFVVGCDRGRILDVSDSVSQLLQYTRGELLGTSWFDILHPKDLSKVKEQLSSSDISRRERLVDAKTLLPVKSDVPQGITRLCPGSRRSFFCRMRCKQSATMKDEVDTGCSKKKAKEKKYCVIHFTGYLKSWTRSKDPIEEENDMESCNLSCLVAVGRVHQSLLSSFPSSSHPFSRQLSYPIEYVSKHNSEGKYVFVDPKASLILQWLPQELLGTSMYEYFHPDDISSLTESHRYVLLQCQQIQTQVYRFRSKNGTFVKLKSLWQTFKNPWTKEIEYLISRNHVEFPDMPTIESTIGSDKSQTTTYANLDGMFHLSGPSETSSMVSSSRLLTEGIHAGKIGRQVVDEVLEGRENKEMETSSVSPLHGILNTMPLDRGTSDTANEEESTDASETRSTYSDSGRVSKKAMLHNNQLLSVGCSANNGNKAASDNGLLDKTSTRDDNDGDSDEAAMAVLMSLLEAEAGLGGPVDFSHLPWPLP